MAAKRTKDQRAIDLALIADLRLKGLMQSEIADIINSDPDRPYTLTQQTIAKDLRAIRKDAYKQAANRLEEMVGDQLIVIGRVEREAFSEWDRSKLNATAKITKVKGEKKGQEGKVTPAEVEQTSKEEGRIADPRFLDLILKAQKQKAALLGLDAPAKHEHEIKAVPSLNVTIEVLPEDEDGPGHPPTS